MIYLFAGKRSAFLKPAEPVSKHDEPTPATDVTVGCMSAPFIASPPLKDRLVLFIFLITNTPVNVLLVHPKLCRYQTVKAHKR